MMQIIPKIHLKKAHYFGLHYPMKGDIDGKQ